MAETVSPLVIRAGTPQKWTTLLWDRPTFVIVQPGRAPGSMFCDVLTYPTGVMPSLDFGPRAAHAALGSVQQTFAERHCPTKRLRSWTQSVLRAPDSKARRTRDSRVQGIPKPRARGVAPKGEHRSRALATVADGTYGRSRQAGLVWRSRSVPLVVTAWSQNAYQRLRILGIGWSPNVPERAFDLH